MLKSPKVVTKMKRMKKIVKLGDVRFAGRAIAIAQLSQVITWKRVNMERGTVPKRSAQLPISSPWGPKLAR